ncbi:MAG: RNA polymerase sigma factor SigZ [Bacteroidota bacterium]
MDQAILNVWIGLNDYLKNFIYKQVRDINIVDDIIQDVFIKVKLNISNLDDKTKLSSWIFQITRNTINDYFRKKQFVLENIIDFEIEDEILYQDETHELAQCINPMIDALPIKYQEAIRLTEIEGISQKALAEKLNISYSAAKSRVQRGRGKLKDLLLQCCSIVSDKYGTLVVQNEKSCSGNC